MDYESSVPTSQSASQSGAAAGHAKPSGERTLLWLAIVIVIIGALGAAVYFLTSSDEGDDGADAGDITDQAQSITVITPGRATITGEITASGSLSARREVPVGVEGEGGRVVAVTVEEGDWVRAGQVLVSINRSVQNQQVNSAAAQVELARVDVRLAQANLDRALQLVDRGFISKAEVDRLTATRDAASARVNVAQSQVRELQVRNARLNIYAPTSGLVLERRVEKGQIVSGASGALFRIAQGGEMELNARLGESDLAKITTGVEAIVVPVGTEREFTGQVWQIAPMIDAQTRQGTARIALPHAHELRPGGFANATIQSGTIVASVLPESAVLSDDEGSYVFVVDKDNKAQRRSVTLGFVTSEGITISAGLNGTEKVVLQAGGFLTEGESVSPRLQKSDGKEKPAGTK